MYIKTRLTRNHQQNIDLHWTKGDHPELDIAELLDENGIQKCQSFIGSLQWAASILRIDIGTTVMSMSSFRSTPRTGHLEPAKRIIGYLSKIKEAKLSFHASLPDYLDIFYVQYDW